MEYSVNEAAKMLGVNPWNLRYAMRTRRNVARRVVGHTMLVTIDGARAALADIRVKHDPYARRRASA